MSTAREFAPPGQNRLLDALPPADRARLRSRLEPVQLSFKQVLSASHEPISHAYFPLGGLVSLLTVMADGAAVEVAVVGNEGVVGLSVFLGARSTPGRVICLIPSHALRLPTEVFRAEAAAGGALDRVLRRYAQGLFTQIAQTAACNRLHPMAQRLARWLLLTHDRVNADEFLLTHEFVSQMLGVRRATVTEALGILQQAGVIGSRRGRITIVDRPGLEAAACECYRIARDEMDHLLG
jgi:CRP-like cAMP-binding protein